MPVDTAINSRVSRVEARLSGSRPAASGAWPPAAPFLPSSPTTASIAMTMRPPDARRGAPSAYAPPIGGPRVALEPAPFKFAGGTAEAKHRQRRGQWSGR